MTRAARLLPAVLLLSALAAPAAALPLFARADSAACARCHVAAAQLNAYGARILRDGYRAPGEAGTSLAPAHGPQVSLVVELGAGFASTDTLAPGGGRGHRNVTESRPARIDLHAAGTVAPRVSYHAAARLDSSSSSVVTTAAFVQFDDLARGRALAFKLGRFDAELPFLSDARRGTRAPYLAPVALPADGVELGGSRGRWLYATGLVNSTRTPSPRSFERLEDVYVWAMRESGGQMLGTRLYFGHQDSNISWHAFLQRLQVQLAGDFGGRRLRVRPGYTLDRFDDRPAPGIHQRHQYALLELWALPDDAARWELLARLEHERTTPTVLTPGEDHDLEVIRAARVVTPNVRAALELAHAGDNVGGPHVTSASLSVQLAY